MSAAQGVMSIRGPAVGPLDKVPYQIKGNNDRHDWQIGQALQISLLTLRLTADVRC